MFQKIYKQFKEFTKEDLIFFLFLILLFIICNIPLNYYITIGGGISDASSRIHVEDGYSPKGSFNISYVTQLDANVLTYAISFLVPSWEREDANLFKYNVNEDLKDIQFRADLDLKSANGTATYWAYTLANKDIHLTSEKLYVIATFPDQFPTELKIQDQILSIDGNEFHKVIDYRNYIATKEVGDLLQVKILRDDKEMTIETPVYEESGVKIIGLSLQYVREYDTNPDVNIKFKRSESGPSGGLITTLEIYNQLTKKDLTKSQIIAGTGTIEEDGSIGEIGGIEHKILGASKAKADIFLCPGGDNYQDAKKYIKEKKLKIKLIQVDTIEDAIKKLEELK